MKLLLAALVVNYLLMAPCFFKNWLELFEKDTSMTSEDRLTSKWVLVLATILWPVVVPIAYLKLLKAQKLNNPIDVSVIEYSRDFCKKSGEGLKGKVGPPLGIRGRGKGGGKLPFTL